MLQAEANSLYLKDEFGVMSYWPNHSGRFNAIHLMDGSSLQVIGEDLASSQTPQIAEQHSGQLRQVFSYGIPHGIPQGGSQTNSTRSQPFSGARRKGAATAKIIHAEMIKNEKGSTTFQEMWQTYVNIKEDKLMLTTFCPKQEMPSMIHL